MQDVITTPIDTGWRFAVAEPHAVKTPAEAETLVFLPAQVPGTNLTDLQAAGLVERDTSASYEESFAPYRYMDFVYTTEFEGGEAAGRRRVFLCFEGLDTVCDVFLNGGKLGSCENAYLAYRFEVSGKVREGSNTLTLLFRAPITEALKRQQQFGVKFPAHLSSDFMFLRKPAYSFFWDWGPELPVSGIYRPVTLKGLDRGEIDEFHVRYTVEGRNVKGTVRVAAREAEGAAVVVRIGRKRARATVTNGEAVVPFALRDAKLWWPNGEGEPHLYDMEVTLEDAEGAIDSRRHRIGFRTVEVVREPRADGEGRRFLVKVNGKEVFCRGYNWIPVDSSLPRGYYDLYRGNLDLARDAHVNMLRVWGGGYYEDDEFYRLCDERGILVWQDGAFACSFYPDSDPHFMELVEQELAYNIKRLRNFTSLVLWCGENETHWGFDEWWVGLRDQFPQYHGTEIYDRLFPELVARLDPDRFYWNGSPYSGVSGVAANDPHEGDSHFWTLHTQCDDLSCYLHTAPSFVSETGVQSLPDLRTALTIGEPEDRHIQSFVFDTRNHFESPAKNERLLKFTGALFRVSEEFQKAVILSNLASAEYLKYAVEQWRSRAYDCAGVLVWQLNDCWPAISWAAVDYNLIPKASHYYLKRAFAPEIVGFKQAYSIDYSPYTNARGDLFVASERDGAKRGVVELRVVRVTGEVLETLEFPLEMEGRGAVSLGAHALPEYRERRHDCVAEFTLRWEDGATARNVYTFSRPKHMRLPWPQVEVADAGDGVLRVCTDVFAKGAYLFHPDPKVVFDDNYLDLMPGEARRITPSRPVCPSEVMVYSYHH